MPAHVIQIGKHRFVSGLFWQSLSRPRELRKEAIELGQRIKFDLMVLRQDHGAAQAGYANTADGVRPGMLSLGAVLARTVSANGAHYDGRQQAVHNWLAALSLPDGQWAYFAVREDSFLPTGDFAGTREEVIDRLSNDYALGGWSVVFGDEELRHIGFHNFHARRLEEFFTHRRNGEMRVHSSWALKSLAVGRHRVLVGAGVVAGAAAIATLYIGWDAHRRQESTRLIVAAMESAKVATNQKPGPPPPHPWPAQPLPVDFARACSEGLVHLAPGGWQLSNYECNLSTAAHSWKRNGSVVAHLLDEVPKAVVAIDGETASVSRPLGAMASARDDVLLPAQTALAVVLSNLQSLGLKPSITLVPPPPPLRTARTGASPPSGPPDWQTYRLSVRTSGMPPVQIAQALEQPGVRLTQAAFNGEDWSIEGVINAK